MKVMSAILIAVSFAISLSAQADQVQFSFSHFAGTWINHEGQSKEITLRALPDGKVEIRGFSSDIVAEPVVLEDRRLTDGSLILQIENVLLEVSSGFRSGGLVGYKLRVRGSEIWLVPSVQTSYQPKGPIGFVCMETVNCMPVVADHMQKFCSDDYRQWAANNCAQAPTFLD